MKKILFAALLLLACVSFARAADWRLVSDPFAAAAGICGDPTQFRARYFVAGAPFAVSNPIAAQSDMSLSLDVQASPVGGPYVIEYWRQWSCNEGWSWISGSIGRFTYWVNSDGSMTGEDASIAGMTFGGNGGNGKLVPVSGAQGKVLLYAPQLAATPPWQNVSASVGTNPASITCQLEYYQLVNQGWSLTSDSAWLTVTPVSGIGGATITCSINVAGMSAGVYTGTITITSPGAVNSGTTFQIYLTLS